LSALSPSAGATARSRAGRGYAIAIIGTALWSGTAVFIRYLTETYRMPPLVLAFWRDLIVAVGLAAALAFIAPGLLRLDARQRRFVLLYGFVLSIFNALWTVAVALDGAAVATVLAYSSPGFTALLAWRLFGEPLTKSKLLAILLSIAGCVLVSGAYDPGAWQVNPLGIVAGLLAGVAFALYSILGKQAAHRALNSWSVMLYTFLCAACFLLLYHALSGWLPGAGRPASLLWLGRNPAGWLALVVLALVPTIGGYGLYGVSLNYLAAGTANLVATLEPSMTALQSYLFLGEHFTLPQVVGSLLVIAGVVILRLAGRS
jgi:drug/metabolite transporter (DMT)-like permease